MTAQVCHPERVSRSPERSEGEGSVVRIRPADLTHVALRTYGESPVSHSCWFVELEPAVVSGPVDW
jgi:hypothetical protein